MDKNTKLVLRIVFCVFLIVGVGLLSGSIIVGISGSRFRSAADEITATISYIESYRSGDGDQSHRVYVNYTYNGQAYEDVKIGMYSSTMYEGKEITILCDRENPRHIKVAAQDMFVCLILGIIGVVFVTVSGILIYFLVRNSKRRKKLLSTGKKLYATVEQIVVNTQFTSNGRNPYLIYCTYRDEYKDLIYRFKSDNIWTDPNLIIKPGDSIQVYVNPEDYSHYYVDTRDLFEGKVIDYT